MRSKVSYLMKYNASLDKSARIVTVCITVLLSVLVIVQVFLFINHRSWSSLVIILLLFLIYLITYLYSPKSYFIRNKSIVVHRPVSDITLLQSDIRHIEVISSQKLKGAVRTFGVGGMFGYFGQFLNKEIGCMTWYATHRENAVVLIEMNNDKKIIISPDESEQFVKQFMSAA